MRLLFDWETNGLLPGMKGGRDDVRGLCAAAIDLDTGELFKAGPDDLDAFTRLVERADFIAGHNIVGFDIPLMELRYGFVLRDDVQIFDTRLVSRMRYVANLLELTIRYRNGAGRKDADRDARFPSALLNPAKQHSLESWGYRIGCLKGEYLKNKGVQEEFSPELLEYCVGDLRTNRVLLDVLLEPDRRGANQWRVKPPDADPREWASYAPAPTLEACLTECRFGRLKYLQERTGIRLDVPGATALAGVLAQRREEIGVELRKEWFPDWTTYIPFTPARGNKTKGYVKGVTIQKPKVNVFNPGSRAQIAERLSTLYGWRPTEFTDTGLPMVNEAVLANIQHPAATKMHEYLTVVKRLGQIAEGDNAWLKLVTEAGLIHGTIHPSGTRTSRCSHIAPNLAQAPSVDSPYGPECRALFSPPNPKHVMVGIDAEKLELCMLAHRLAYYDGGSYAKTLLEGDPHSDWQKATGVFIRNNQKRVTYGYLYGAGDTKLGEIMLDDWRQAHAKGITDRKPPPMSAAKDLGAAARRALESKVLGLGPLKEACDDAFKRGWVRGLDGRIIPTKSQHGVVNDVLQSDGAIVMKHAHVHLVYDRLLRDGLVLGEDFDILLDIHDEWQFGALPEHAEYVGQQGREAITWAGEKLGVRCPLSGASKIGRNWCETH
jgi:hypothetical protein